MLELLLDSRSSFDSTKRALAQWIRRHLVSVRVLTTDEISAYDERNFISGWSAKIRHNDTFLAFHILIDACFPYSSIRVAYKSEETYLKWPHVERGGLFCLPVTSSPISGVEDVILETITTALNLIEQCHDPQFVENEFRREFVSYWDRGNHSNGKVKRVRSLLDLNDRTSRQISIWYGEKFTLAGETPEQVCSWLNYLGRGEKSCVKLGVFGYLDQAPIPQFPDSPSHLFDFLKKNCPSIDTVIGQHPVNEKLAIVLAASSQNGVGLISVHLSKPSLKGFRKNHLRSLAAKKKLWSCRSMLKRTKVARYDSSWVHGRGLDSQLIILHQSNVLVLGCGSLGSQVAVRLAQTGIGRLILIDPDKLEAANVGRHALGIDSAGQSKAVQLAKSLRARFPHMRSVEGHSTSWQKHLAADSEIFEQTDLIVACLGEWAADGQLSEWQMRAQTSRVIVYGWLDEQGTASHALALTGQGPALSCLLNTDGRLRTPETLWEHDSPVQAEPACGTIFQPYGPLEVANAESLVARLCVDILVSRPSLPVHRIYACPTAQLLKAGGEWSAEHLKYRPQEFEGAFEYERPVLHCGICQACKEST